jgi:8-oxo-dGTP pyrophosphatase MutT (NUDIX family)
VAAVCFRKNGNGVEFLLVQTDGGRWTFPKGNIKPWVGARKSAQLEAMEEAGAEGAVDERPFHTYITSKGVFWRAEGVQEYSVQTYLLEVKRTRMPAEEFREPTWFPAATVRERLAEGRERKYAQELARAVDESIKAISKIKNLPSRNGHRSSSHSNSSLPLFMV